MKIETHNMIDIVFMVKIILLSQKKNSFRKRPWSHTCERLRRRNSSAKLAARRSSNKENSPSICDHTREISSIQSLISHFTIIVFFFLISAMNGHFNALSAINLTKPAVCERPTWIPTSVVKRLRWVHFIYYYLLLFRYLYSDRWLFFTLIPI